MMGSGRSFGLAVAISVLFCSGLAQAQENLDFGKTPAQLYASDCAICHKNPRGLSTAGGIFGLQSFLQQHYTASRKSAAAIAAYLKSIDRSAAPTGRRRKAQPNREPNKPAEKNKLDEKRPEEKAAEEKSGGSHIGQRAG